METRFMLMAEEMGTGSHLTFKVWYLDINTL